MFVHLPHLLLWIFFALPGASVFSQSYTFGDFPSRGDTSAMIHFVNLKNSPEARRFRNRLQEAVGKPPDFGGFYRVVTWGAGTMAQQAALVDARDGQVYLAPFTSMLGIQYEQKSCLLVENPPEEIKKYLEESGGPKPVWLKSVYWLWDEPRKMFRQLGPGGK